MTLICVKKGDFFLEKLCNRKASDIEYFQSRPDIKKKNVREL